MSTRKSVSRTQPGKKSPAAPQPLVQEALEVTWTLKGHLKNAQIAHIRVGALLATVRDKKFYAELDHADMESYSEVRLRLGRASLYRYLQVYDWIVEFHKEWLLPKPEGFIPDLADCVDLIWIEQELARPDLDPKKRAALEALKKKAYDGVLRKGELDAFRRRGHKGEQGLKSFLSRVRLLRKRGSELAALPSEAISHLDAAIEIIAKALAAKRAGKGPAVGRER